MPTQVLAPVASSTGDEQLTTGEAARMLGSSRQHVVDLCDRGDLPFSTTGSHRRLRRGDVAALQARTEHLTRDQERSLWLAHAIAGALVEDPERVLAEARHNLQRLRRQHRRGQLAEWLAEWQALLDGPIEQLLAVLTSRTPRARELRQNNPFAGVLPEDTRARVLGAFSSTQRGRG